jgi:hypothetical protein
VRRNVSALALALAACAAPPDAGTPAGSRLAGPLAASVQPPAECGPLVGTASRATCGWTSDTGNAFAVVLSETRLDMSKTGVGAASLASIPEPPRPEDGFEIDQSHVERFLAEELPGATLRELAVSRPQRLPPGSIDCLRFAYVAAERGASVRGRGLVCSAYERPATLLRLVHADVSERSATGLGQGPVDDFPAFADRTLATLRMR